MRGAKHRKMCTAQGIRAINDRETALSARRCSVHRISAVISQGYCSVNDLHYVSGDTHIGDGVTALFGADVDGAGASSLDSLLDQALDI